MASATIAVLGLGAMGSAIARNLARAGFDLRVWNRTPRPDAVPGARVCASPAEACAGAEFAVSMLADDAAVERVTFARDGILQGLARGACHVGMSTISVDLARRLVDAHAAAGQGYVAAPVFGRPDAAEAAKLWVIPGGPEPYLKRCEPLFAAVGQGTFVVGNAPQATLAKLLGNFMIVSAIEALAEALATAEKAELDPGRLLDMLTSTFLANPAIRRYGEAVAAARFQPVGFALRLGLKDVNLMLRAAEEVGAPLPIANLVRDHLLTAISQGRAELDWSALASAVREDAGLPPVRDAGAPGSGTQAMGGSGTQA